MARIQLGSRLRELTPATLESALLGARVYTRAASGWTGDVRREGLQVDLSRIEWFELGALVQLILFVENAAQSNIDIEVALPLPRPRTSERDWMQLNREFADSVRRRVVRRQRALEFLQYLQFEPILNEGDLRPSFERIRVLREYDSSEADLDDDLTLPYAGESPPAAAQESEEKHEYLYRYVLPLTWLRSNWAHDLPDLPAFLAAVIGEPRRGLDVLDARSITNVILYELIQNVELHAQSMTPALVAAWARPSNLLVNPEHYLEPEQAYVHWVNEKQTPMVEVVVGDSGRGVVEVLTDAFKKTRRHQLVRTSSGAKVMLWSFDRWSSSKDATLLRGTRGLYRVNRIVKKYQGLATMRSSNQFVGLDHGGPAYDEEFGYPGRLAYIPGTVLRLRIPPFKTESTPRPGPIQQRVRHLKVVRVGSIDEDGLSIADRNELVRALDSNESACIIAVPDGSPPMQRWTEAALRQAAELRHPGALVLYDCLGNWDSLENTVDSVNAEHEAEHRGIETYAQEHYEIWDPVLVVGPSGQFAWVGTNAVTRIALDALVQEGGNLSSSRIEELIREPGARAAFLLTVRNDTSLFDLTDEGEIRLRFAPEQVGGAIADSVSAQLLRHIEERKPGILNSGPYLSPSLQVRSLWIDVSALLETSTGTGLAMLALAIRIRSHPAWQSYTRADVLVADSGSLQANLALLQSHLNVSRRETPPAWTDLSAATEVRVLERGTCVLLYFDVVATGQSARREIRRILREEARPLAVVCLIDARPDDAGDELIVWDVGVPVISLLRAPALVHTQDVDGEEIVNIDPIIGYPEESDRLPRTSTYAIPPKDIEKKIQEYNALHFTHIGRPLGRHFTFYLDATRFLQDTSVIETFSHTIDEWLASADNTGLSDDKQSMEIWYAEPEPKPSEPARRFAEALRLQRTDVVRVQSITRHAAYGHLFFARKEKDSVRAPNVVVVDWGALTGTTVTQAIRMAADAGAERILVCVFLSQLSADEEVFLTSLEVVSSRYVKTPARTTLLLPGFSDPKELLTPSDGITSKRRVEVTVRFLSRFPVDSYDQHDCPVCQQLSRLSQESYPTKMLAEFAQEQRTTRLRQRSREELLDSPPRDFESRALSGDYILKMAQFRVDLVDALRSTRSRSRIRDYVLQLREVHNETVDKRPDESAALIHFLSVETQWLRRPPLHSDEMRSAVAEIAMNVALQQDRSIADRLNGLVVLRTSSKEWFAREFGRVFAAVCQSEELGRQHLYDAFTYIARPYHQSASVLDSLCEQLREVKVAVDGESLVIPGTLSQTLTSLEIRARTEMSKAEVRDISITEVWNRLRHSLGNDYADHDPVDESVLMMQPGLDAALIDRAVSAPEIEAGLRSLPQSVIGWLQGIDEHWRRCQVFLDYTVLPLLVRVRHIIRSHDGKRALGADTAARIDDLLAAWDRKQPIAESSFSKLVFAMSRIPKSVFSDQMWKDYKSECEWIREALLKARTHRNPGSRLVEFVLSLPSNLSKELAKGIAEIEHDLPPTMRILGVKEIPEKINVFCPAELIRDTIRELVFNARKRASSEAVGLDVSLATTTYPDRVVLWVRNNSTEPKPEGSGFGLRKLSTRLEAFEGTLDIEPRPADPQYSFEVAVGLKLGG